MQKTKEVYEVAINLGRIWGVMETLENIPTMKELPATHETMESILGWAEEYVSSGQTDMLEFMKEKLNTYKEN